MCLTSSVNVIDNWPDEAFTSIKTDQNTAIITLTHDAKIDDIALQIALKSDCFYIGCLGSIKTHEKRIDRLLNMGFNKSIINFTILNLFVSFSFNWK